MRVTAAAILFLYLAVFPVTRPASACTSFCLDTPGGPFFATNLDLSFGEGLVFVNQRGIAKESYLQNTKGESAKWTSRYGSVSFNLVGREFAWSGINEAGLVVSSMELRNSELPPPDERMPLGIATWVQYVLDNCGSVGEVVQLDSLVRVQDGAIPSHYMVADADGECAVIEYLGGRCRSYTGDTLPVRALANATYEASVTYLERGIVPAMNPGASVERVAAAADLAKSFSSDPGTSPVDYAFKVLTEAVVARKSFWRDLFHEPYTRWSVVYDTSNREVYFRTVESPEVKRLSLASLDFSCDVPLRMLDVNSELAGNVARYFSPYDHDVNVKVFSRFCAKMDIDVTKEVVVELTRFFEKFACE